MRDLILCGLFDTSVSTDDLKIEELRRELEELKASKTSAAYNNQISDISIKNNELNIEIGAGENEPMYAKLITTLTIEEIKIITDFARENSYKTLGINKNKRKRANQLVFALNTRDNILDGFTIKSGSTVIFQGYNNLNIQNITVQSRALTIELGIHTNMIRNIMPLCGDVCIDASMCKNKDDVFGNMPEIIRGNKVRSISIGIMRKMYERLAMNIANGKITENELASILGFDTRGIPSNISDIQIINFDDSDMQIHINRVINKEWNIEIKD